MTGFECASAVASDRVGFSAGSVIFQEGDPGETMYVIMEGIVKIQVAGRRMATIGPGGTIGEMAVISKQPRSATAVAETDCVLKPIESLEFAALTQNVPALVADVLDALSERLRRATFREADRHNPFELQIRLATMDDLPAIREVVEQALRVLSLADYSPQQLESALGYVAGTDTPDLIADGTYFVAEVAGQIAGVGGWSRRRALYGVNTGGGIDDREMLDPARDAAKIRQFYVHPRWAKRGIARRLLQTCEEAARVAGFRRLELAATLTGEPLYGVQGFKRVAPMEITLPDGVTLQVIKMTKDI